MPGENLSGGKLHMIRPASDPSIPWTALLIGLWIPNFFYWGLNQYIVQRTLGSKSLAEGQRGIVFAAAPKCVRIFRISPGFGVTRSAGCRRRSWGTQDSRGARPRRSPARAAQPGPVAGVSSRGSRRANPSF